MTGRYMTNKDYYAILNVPRNATPAQIKTSYRTLVLKLHPDKKKVEDKFDFTFNELQQAYETLSVPEKRFAYDSLPQEWLPNINLNDSMLQEFLKFNQSFRNMGFSVKLENNKACYEKDDLYFYFDFANHKTTVRYKDHNIEFRNANEIYYYVVKMLVLQVFKITWHNKYVILAAITTFYVGALSANRASNLLTGQELSNRGLFFGGIAGLVLRNKIKKAGGRGWFNPFPSFSP